MSFVGISSMYMFCRILSTLGFSEFTHLFPISVKPNGKMCKYMPKHMNLMQKLHKLFRFHLVFLSRQAVPPRGPPSQCHPSQAPATATSRVGSIFWSSKAVWNRDVKMYRLHHFYHFYHFYISLNFQTRVELLLVCSNFLCNVKQDCIQQPVESWHVENKGSECGLALACHIAEQWNGRHWSSNKQHFAELKRYTRKGEKHCNTIKYIEPVFFGIGLWW